MRAARLLIAVLTVEALALAFSTPQENAQVDQGKDLFARRCSGCHAADIDMEGPRLRGVYGRTAGGVPGFGYSDSLRNLKIRWDEKRSTGGSTIPVRKRWRRIRIWSFGSTCLRSEKL